MAQFPNFRRESEERREPLRIRIRLVGESLYEGLRLITQPNMVTVTVGTPILWMVESKVHAEPVELRWSIRFRKGHPFASSAIGWELLTGGVRGPVLPAHEGEFGLLTAQAPGDYKYDVHVNDANTARSIADEDPYLIVVAP